MELAGLEPATSWSGQNPQTECNYRHHEIDPLQGAASAMELAGLEPATSWVRSRRSPKLSYSPGELRL